MISLIYISALSILLPILAGLFCYKFLTFSEKLFLYFMGIGAITEIVLHILVTFHINNHFIVNIYILLEFILILFILATWIGEFSIKIPFKLIIAGFVLYWGINVLINGIGLFMGPLAIAAHAILVILSGLLLTQLMLHTDSPLFKNLRFWIASGVLIYFSTGIIRSAILSLFVDNNNLFLSTWYSNLHSGVNISGSLLYSIGFLCKLPKTN